ncbi:MAG: hypothetical protein JO335_10405 [Sphingomonas sp.]|nr:hypothetical protein [Sphingomonas sp.]
MAEAVAERRSSVLPMFIAILLIPAVLASSQTIFSDGDVSWHIATGQWILNHRAIPHTDPFSFTWAGKPWVPIEWLSELLYASAYRLAGYGGVSALVTAAFIALHAVVFVNTSRWVRWVLLPIVAMDLVLIPMLSARPHVLTWPLLAFWIWLMMRAREQDRAPPLAAALLMSIWANLHGGFVFGLAIAAAFALEALVVSPDKPKALRQWLLFGLASAAATFINGNGVEGVFHPLRFTQLQMLPLIDEWKPSNPATTPYSFAVLAVVAGLIIWKRPRLHWVRWLLLAAFLCLALFQVRHQAMLAIVAAMILPQGFSRSAVSPPESRLNWIAAGGAVLLVLVRAVMPLTPPDNAANPWKLIAAVPPQLRSQPVLNGYSMGGPLILSGIRPYIDGRGDMYGDELVLGYYRIVRGDGGAFENVVRRWGIRWVIVANSNGLVPLLEKSPQWRLYRRDSVGVIYIRSGG